MAEILSFGIPFDSWVGTAYHAAKCRAGVGKSELRRRLVTWKNRGLSRVKSHGYWRTIFLCCNSPAQVCGRTWNAQGSLRVLVVPGL